MRRQHCPIQCLLPALLVGMLTLPAQWLWTQEPPSPAQTPVQLFDPSIQFATGPAADGPLRRLPGTAPLSFGVDQGRSGSQVRLFPRYAGYNPIALDDARGLKLPRPSTMAEGITRDFGGSARSNRLTSPPGFGEGSDRTIQRGDDLEHYSRHIPLAGSIVLRVRQQARTHPQVTRVLRLLVPAAK